MVLASRSVGLFLSPLLHGYEDLGGRSQSDLGGFFLFGGLEGEGVGHGVVPLQVEAVSRGQAVGTGIGEEARVVVQQVDYLVMAGGGLGEGHAAGVGGVPVTVGNGGPVGVVGGVVEHGGHALDEAVGDDVLEDFGLFVDFVPGQAHDVGEEALDEAMPADDLEGFALPEGREADPPARLVVDESLLAQALDHHRDGARGEGEGTGQLPQGNGIGSFLAQVVEGFEVILVCGTWHEGRA